MPHYPHFKIFSPKIPKEYRRCEEAYQIQGIQALGATGKARIAICRSSEAISFQSVHSLMAHQLAMGIHGESFRAAQRMKPNATVAVNYVTGLVGLHQFNAFIPKSLLQRVDAGLRVIREHRHVKRRRLRDLGGNAGIVDGVDNAWLWLWTEMGSGSGKSRLAIKPGMLPSKRKVKERKKTEEWNIALRGANPLVLSTTAATPLVTQAAGLVQTSIVVPQPPLPVFRQPTTMHLPHYPPNYIPYGHYFSPFYPPPAIHQFFSNGAYPQQPQAGSVYQPPPAATTKYSLSQYKQGA
nr:GBF-interacting protein 1-like isoform X4 [Ipomoea batatas]